MIQTNKTRVLNVSKTAEQVSYDNKESGLNALDVQQAIDELNNKSPDVQSLTNSEIEELLKEE